MNLVERLRAKVDNTMVPMQLGNGQTIKVPGLGVGTYDSNEDWYEFILMQFTGLKDKNGKEIYEGDIVKIGILLNELVIYEGVVAYSNGRFTCDTGKLEIDWWRYEITKQTIEIIGNIHENPELLENK